MIDVRRAQEQEFGAIGELTARAYLAEGAVRPDDPYLDVLRDAAARAVGAELWVAVDDRGTLLGTVTTCPCGSPFRELAGDEEGEFRTLAVDPAARGRGVGRLLAEHCLARAAAEGFPSVVISTAEWMTTAHRLYARLGFTRAPQRDWWPRPDLRLLALVRSVP